MLCNNNYVHVNTDDHNSNIIICPPSFLVSPKTKKWLELLIKQPTGLQWQFSHGLIIWGSKWENTKTHALTL